jgi:hypothetical protein
MSNLDCVARAIEHARSWLNSYTSGIIKWLRLKAKCGPAGQHSDTGGSPGWQLAAGLQGPIAPGEVRVSVLSVVAAIAAMRRNL